MCEDELAIYKAGLRSETLIKIATAVVLAFLCVWTPFGWWCL